MTLSWFHGIFILCRLNGTVLENLGYKPISGEFSVENIPRRPVYLAGFAVYITLGVRLTTCKDQGGISEREKIELHIQF